MHQIGINLGIITENRFKLQLVCRSEEPDFLSYPKNLLFGSSNYSIKDTGVNKSFDFVLIRLKKYNRKLGRVGRRGVHGLGFILVWAFS